MFGWLAVRLNLSTAVARFRGPGLHLIRSHDSSVSVNRHVIRVYFMAPEMKQKVVHKLLLVSVEKCNSNGLNAT